MQNQERQSHFFFFASVFTLIEKRYCFSVVVQLLNTYNYFYHRTFQSKYFFTMFGLYTDGLHNQSDS